MFDSLTQDVRYALRALKANPAFTAVAVLSLALGIGANSAIFSLLDAVLLKYLPVQHPEELLQLKVGKRAGVSNPLWEALRDRQDVFSGVFAWNLSRFNLAASGESSFVNGLWVSGDFFRTLGIGAALGRTLTPADDHRGCGATSPAAVLSYHFWQARYAGDPAILGKIIQLDAHSFQIVGVAPPAFFGVDIGRFFDVAVPLCSVAVIQGGNGWLDRRNFSGLSIIGRPKAGLTAQQVEARLQVLGPAMLEASVPLGGGAQQQRFLRNTFAVERAEHGVAVKLDWVSESDFRSRYGRSLALLMVVAGLVLLIACANVANLLLARAAARQKEIAIRLAVGAGRARLIRQLLTESVLLASAGAAIGLLFASWSGRALLRLISTQGMRAQLDLTIDSRLLAFTAVVALFTGVLFGIAPAFRATGLAAQSILKESQRRSSLALGKALVVFQIALSFVLVFGAGLFLRTFQNLLTQDAGFDRDRILLITADIRNTHYPAERRQALYDALLDRISAVPSVRSASQSGMTPLDSSFSIGPIAVSSGLKETVERCYFNTVSPGYFETMGTPLRLGRDFARSDSTVSPGVAIVNEALAREAFGVENPLGRTFRLKGPTGNPLTEVIGLVKDAKYSNLRQSPPPTIYLPSSQRPWGPPGGLPTTNFAVRSVGPVTDLIPALKKAMANSNRDVTFEFRVFATQVKESLVQERLLATLSSVFGALALALATVGLYGLMSYTAGRRRGEIGIRMALGARRRNVVWLILREVGMLAGIGVGLGAVVAVSTARLVASMFYGIAPGDARTVLSSVVVLLASAAVAGYLPARRASLVEPMAALRDK